MRFLLGLLLLSMSSPVLGGFPDEDGPVRAHVAVKNVRLVDNGDNDGFADPNETVSLYVTLRNGSGSDRHGIVVRMGSTDPTVACIPTPIVSFGSLLAGEVREGTAPLLLRVADVTRLDPSQDLSMTFEFVISGDDFQTTKYPQRIGLDVDLNMSGGILPTSYTEGFESGGFGSFTTQSLDAGHEGTNAASDGLRCQYNDPDFVNSFSYGNTYCFLGAPSPVQNAYDWHVHAGSAPDGGRAYLGNNSLHWGVHAGSAGMDTTHLRQLDAIRTTNPVNLGWNGVSSELSFKHQIGLADCWYFNCAEPPGAQTQTFDRGVVQVQIASSSGVGQGAWRKLHPYENVYDGHAVYWAGVCAFDPTDDGNDEDDYFDPEDPYRRAGPSSTCFPEFGFSRQGAIAFNDVFSEIDIARASDGPGLQGSRGPGTWVETKFDLARYRGRRIRLRFLATSIEISSASTWQDASGWNPDIPEIDDGWYIDDVRVTNALTSAATVSVDTSDRSGLPACGPVCTSVTASVEVPSVVQCGQAFTVDASGSAADQCPGGVLQFRFWANWKAQSQTEALSEHNADMLQDWSENGVLSQVIDEPMSWFPPRQYGVDVRCSTRPACEASTTVAVMLDHAPIPFPSTIRFDSKTVLSWEDFIRVDALRGDLHALRASGGDFNGTVDLCLRSDSLADSLSDGTLPQPGEAKYYLLREHHCCNTGCSADSYSTGATAEVPGAGSDRDDDIALDPDHCMDPWE